MASDFAGNQGWAYKDVLKNFKSIENFCNTDTEFHSSQGELPITLTNFDNIIYDRFIAAGRELGMPANDDFNGKTQDGVGRYHANVFNGKRIGTGTAFLKPLKDNPKLTIQTHALVERIVIENGCAKAVDVTIKGKKKRFYANNEIILSAGAFNSPQILMLSGVGDQQALKQQGIELKKHLPGVGKNLQDHISFLFNYECNQPITMNGPANSVWQQLLIALQFFLLKKGPAAHNMIEAGGFGYTQENLTAPDVQFHVVPTLMYNLVDNVPKQHGISVRACYLTPNSRGEVGLYSNKPSQQAKIDFKFLSDERDIKPLLEIFDMCERLAKADAWQGLIGKEVKGASDCKTREQKIGFIRKFIETDYHPVGTCKMGNDAMAVVDSQLKVHGIEGLRVADASIMPTIVRGNTSIPCMMIGDKIAEMILSN